MRKFLTVCYFSSLALSNTSEAFKKEHAQIQNHIEKMVEKNSTTYGMHEALKTEYEELDKLLNKYYNQLMKTLNDEQKIHLRNSQREWLKFRDKEYEFYSLYYHAMGGTMWGLVSSENRNAIMLRRIEEIVKLISDGEPL